MTGAIYSYFQMFSFVLQLLTAWHDSPHGALVEKQISWAEKATDIQVNGTDAGFHCTQTRLYEILILLLLSPPPHPHNRLLCKTSPESLVEQKHITHFLQMSI